MCMYRLLNGLNPHQYLFYTWKCTVAKESVQTVFFYFCCNILKQEARFVTFPSQGRGVPLCKTACLYRVKYLV